MTSPRASEIVPDFSAIERYAEMVFGYLDGCVPVRAFSETGTTDRPPVTEFHRIAELPQALNAMAGRASKESRGLYVVPATVARPGSARVKDIVQTGVVVIDLDAGDIRTARDHLASNLGLSTCSAAYVTRSHTEMATRRCSN